MQSIAALAIVALVAAPVAADEDPLGSTLRGGEGGLMLDGDFHAGLVGFRMSFLRAHGLGFEAAVATAPQFLGEVLLIVPDAEAVLAVPVNRSVAVVLKGGLSGFGLIGQDTGLVPALVLGAGVVAQTSPKFALRVDYALRSFEDSSTVAYGARSGSPTSEAAAQDDLLAEEVRS